MFGPIAVQENDEIAVIRRIKASQLSTSESLIEWRMTFEGGKGPRHYIKDAEVSAIPPLMESVKARYLGV